MPIEIVKETIEIDSLTLDADGQAFVQKRINLPQGKLHELMQTDIFQDTYSYFQNPV